MWPEMTDGDFQRMCKAHYRDRVTPDFCPWWIFSLSTSLFLSSPVLPSPSLSLIPSISSLSFPFKKKIGIFIIVVTTCVHAHMLAVACRSQKKVPDGLELGFLAVVSHPA